MTGDAPTIEAPAWFRRALAVPFTDGHVDVGGGRGPLPGVGASRAGGAWCSCTAARRTPTGGRTSPRRSPPTSASWRSTCPATATAGTATSTRFERGPTRSWPWPPPAASTGPPVVVGHSMGGFVTIATAALHSDRLAGVVVCDSPVTEPDPEVDAARARAARSARRRTYPSRRRGAGAVPHRPAPGPLPALRHRPRGPALAAPRPTAAGAGSSTRGLRPVLRGHARRSPCPTCARSAAASRCCGRSTGS